jgi:hypothetical protein
VAGYLVPPKDGALFVLHMGVSKKNREKKTTNSITDSEFIPHLLMVFKWSFGGE